MLARLAAELDDSTDAVILQRQNRADWEMPYLAVINCRGWHRSRRYFSKWHEVIHLLLDGKQLRFAFRKRAAKRKHPEEVLVDKIAGELAFHPDLFGPCSRLNWKSAGRLTFDVVERVLAEIAPDASRESALYACVRHCPEPVFFLKARLLYKNSERRQLDDLLSGLDDVNLPQPKLRVQSSSANDAAAQLGVRFHENMQVPETSLVSQAFNGSEDRVEGQEPLEIWQTSSGGPIGHGRLYSRRAAEATRFGAWCTPIPSDQCPYAHRQQSRTEGSGDRQPDPFLELDGPALALIVCYSSDADICPCLLTTAAGTEKRR